MINHDFYMKPHCGGIKLLPSKNKLMNATRVSEFFSAAKFNIYFLDFNSSMLDANEYSAETMGFDSPYASIGKSVFDISDYNCALKIRKNDLNILKTKRMKIIEEDLFRVDGKIFQTLSIKCPLYNEDNEMLGILGNSIVLDAHPLASSLALLSQIGFLNPSKQLPGINNFYLSSREKECLKLIVRGKTAREISNHLSLSQRTIEHYIENIKIKLNVSTKSELIDKAFDWFQ